MSTRRRTIGRAAAAALALAALAQLAAAATAPAQSDAERLKAELTSQLAEVESHFAVLRDPSAAQMAGARLAVWQAELATRFRAAAETVEEIIKLNPPDVDHWRERLETLTLYAQPNSPPDARNVFGAREVSKRARVTEAPAAEPTAEARAAKVKGEVRLRAVLASDGTVKHIFPVKSLGHGLTEAAVAAARGIKFEPAERAGQPASQFVTLVYDFKGDKPAKPYVPKTIF